MLRGIELKFHDSSSINVVVTPEDNQCCFSRPLLQIHPVGERNPRDPGERREFDELRGRPGHQGGQLQRPGQPPGFGTPLRARSFHGERILP